MFLALLSRLGCNVASYLYPAYASYKALSLHPDSSPEAMAQVERWLMYWSVVGSWTAIEAIFGWAFNWLPFYSFFKAIVLLYLSLPQSEGSTYIYRNHLAPLFSEHEADIDAFLASLRSRAGTALAGGIGWAWEKAKAQLNIAGPPQGYGVPGGQPGQISEHDRYNPPAQSLHQPPTLQDPASGALQQMYGLAARYAGQYLPVAISAISAAAASAQGQRILPQAGQAGDRADQAPVPGSIAMPVPVPTPGVRAEQPSSSLRSRTYQQASSGSVSGFGSGFAQAQAQLQALSSARQSPYPSLPTPPGQGQGQAHNQARPYSLSTSNSEDSISSNAASVSSNPPPHPARWAEMSYEQIGREEALGAPGAPGIGGQRPEMGKRGSSWFPPWGGATPERAKAE